MKNKVRSIAVLLAIVLVLFLMNLLDGAVIQAATQDTTGSIGFYVQAVLPENQLDKNLTYFDLRVRPGQAQTLEVEVVNESNEAITVTVDAISASTNRNGVIDYKTPDIRDTTLEHPFSELATPESSALTIPAQSSVTARVTVEMPADEYDGVVLGGLVFTQRPDGEDEATQDMTIKNVYSYVIGVKLNENDTPVSPGFELESIQAETVNYQPAIVHYIRNFNAAIAKDIDLQVVVRDAEGNAVAEIEKTGIDMAPNSIMPLAVTTATGSGNGSNGGTAGNAASGELAPGEYTSHITLEHGGESWSFEQKFTIGSIEAEQINNAAIGSVQSTESGMPYNVFFIILLVVAVAVIVALFIIILLMLRRREETKELNRLRKQRQEQLRIQEKTRQWD